MSGHKLPEPAPWKTAVGDVGFHKILVHGYKLTDIIENLTFSETLFLALKGELPTRQQARVMDAVLTGITEHGFFTPTTVAARVIGSASPRSIMPAVAGSLLTVGSVTVSPQDTAELIEEALGLQRSEGLSREETARKMVARLRERKVRMPGVGHPLHPTGDPRAISLKKIAVENGVWGEKGEMYEAVRDAFCAGIKKDLPINIDGMLGCVLSELGFSPLAMPGIAAISFLPGIIAHTVEEISQGVMLRVVSGEYVGPAERELPPEYKRGSGLCRE
ncbi:MAG: citryl-CoA lyase [Bacillota bacterium]